MIKDSREAFFICNYPAKFIANKVTRDLEDGRNGNDAQKIFNHGIGSLWHFGLEFRHGRLCANECVICRCGIGRDYECLYYRLLVEKGVEVSRDGHLLCDTHWLGAGRLRHECTADKREN